MRAIKKMKHKNVIFTTTMLCFLFLLVILTNAESIKSNTVLKEQVEKNILLQEAKDITSGFTFDELNKLSNQTQLDKELSQKLDNHLSMVFVFNRNNDFKLNKNYVRVAYWNIKRGYNVSAIKNILLNPKKYEKEHKKNLRRWDWDNLKEELETFSSADIICLNEADIGLPRTEYKNIVTEIANTFNFNYAYATEFFELGSLFLMSSVNKDLYKGLQGTTIISKFPIVSSRVIRLPNYYDWYNQEIKKHHSPIEHFRKFGARLIFSQNIERHEIRHGGRHALIADIKLPNNDVITVITTHLEDRAYPDERLKQFKYLLEQIKYIKTPVILAGDFNTSTTDTKPTSFKKEVEKRIRDPHFIARAIGSGFVPGLPFLSGFAAVAFSKLLQYKDPFFPSIPIIFPNHERGFYITLKEFKFEDNYGFDLSGDKKRSSNGKRGLLANSNQRHWKGFKSTFKLEKPRIIAYFKLDWFFVKPIGNHFYPFNGRTLKSLNRSLKDQISDHNPITVDIKL